MQGSDYSRTNVTMCREIRSVEGGYIVVIRLAAICDFKEVVCKTFDEVVAMLRREDPKQW